MLIAEYGTFCRIGLNPYNSLSSPSSTRSRKSLCRITHIIYEYTPFCFLNPAQNVGRKVSTVVVASGVGSAFK